MIVDDGVEDISRAEEGILAAVSKAGGKVKLSAVIDELGREGFDNDVVREAAWHLLDQGEVRLTSKRELRLTSDRELITQNSSIS